MFDTVKYDPRGSQTRGTNQKKIIVSLAFDLMLPLIGFTEYK